MVSHAAFLLMVVGLVAAQRMWELSRSAGNEALLRQRGAREHAPGQVPYMIALHVLWFVAMLCEGLVAPHPLPWVACIAALVAFVTGQILRLRAMRALGPFWTIKIITLPGAHVVAQGPFRFIRHPNYLGVWLETLALPLVVGAPWTALVFAIAQSVFLHFRVRAEEAALLRTTDYAQKLGQHGRFVPRRSHGAV
jgi:methyltransferase